MEPIDTLLEAGRVLALNFPIAMNPGLARIIGVMLKLDFQRAVLQRIPKISAQPDRVWRDLMFVCDEYHAFATVGETDPTGDERTFALSRQARLIPIVATQSISSLAFSPSRRRELANAAPVLPQQDLPCDQRRVHGAERRRTVRAPRPAQGALHPLGVRRDAHISLLTGRADGRKPSIIASKSYAPHHEYIFAPRVFTQLQNAQAIVLPYDGINPLPPQFCYLKPHYLDVQTSHFDHLARGAL